MLREPPHGDALRVLARPPDTLHAKLEPPEGAKLIKSGDATLGYTAPKPANQRPPISTLRMREIERLIQYRHSGVCDTDDAEIYFEVVLYHIDLEPAKFWASRWCPNLSTINIYNQITQFLRLNKCQKRSLKAADMGGRLKLKHSERKALRITTFQAFDVSQSKVKKEQAKSKRKKNKERAEQKRRKNGISVRITYGDNKPWLAVGMSETTWRRRQKINA
jgi:hypothetical protein